MAHRCGLFRTSLRIMTVFLAICALLIRTFVLRMICLARIAESALACVMSGSLALVTQTVRTRVRVPALSCRDTYRAACVRVVIRLARIAENALARHMSGMALGTNALRTRVRVARVPRRDAYRAYFGQPSYPVTCAAEPQ
jgi:hypothetical protein